MVGMGVNTEHMYACLSVSVMGWDRIKWKKLSPSLPLPPRLLPARLDPPPVTTAPCQHALSLQSLYLTTRIPLSRAPSHWPGRLAAMRRQ